MKWYQGLSREQRDEVLGYTLGYLDAIANGTVANDVDACIKSHSIRLLDHLRVQARGGENDQSL